jgi:Arc/MetJ-type ribon-helix-helix transcriptional regulator
MQLKVPPDLETLINKRLSRGGYTSVEDVLRRALEAQDAEESWTGEERRALSSHIEEGYLQFGARRAYRRRTGAPRDSGAEGELARRALPQAMSRYVLTPLAKGDIFDVWSYILLTTIPGGTSPRDPSVL